MTNPSQPPEPPLETAGSLEAEPPPYRPTRRYLLGVCLLFGGCGSGLTAVQAAYRSTVARCNAEWGFEQLCAFEVIWPVAVAVCAGAPLLLHARLIPRWPPTVGSRMAIGALSVAVTSRAADWGNAVGH